MSTNKDQASENSSRKRRLSQYEDSTATRQCEREGRTYGPTRLYDNASAVLGDYHTHYHVQEDPQTRARDLALDSLKFDQMHSRYEQVCEAKEGTYQWILDDSKAPENERPVLDRIDYRRQFKYWLEHGNGVFWVTGKPGSGKSTLMKYLVSRFTTSPVHAALSSNFLDRNVHLPIVLYHFFWISGTLMQRNVAGCLRSLLMQLIQDPRSTSAALRRIVGNHHVPWTEYRLRTILVDALQEVQTPVFIFLDGLDECAEVHACLEILQILGRGSNSRVCVSSRPEREFVLEFDTALSIRMQDVNAHDIKTVIQKDLRENGRVRIAYNNSTSGECESELEELAHMLQTKADGVFLWVHLVIKNLLKGIGNCDSIQMLNRRVEQMPSSIYELFCDMLKRQGDDVVLYQDEASFYLRFMIHRQYSPSLLELYLATNDAFRAYCLHSYTKLTVRVFDEIDAGEVAIRVESRTAGLLEVVPYNAIDEASRSDTVCVGTARLRNVRFIHRTVRDFLTDSIDGQRLVAGFTNSDHKMRTACVEAKVISNIAVPYLAEEVDQGPPVPHMIFQCQNCSDKVYLPYLPMVEEMLRYFWHGSYSGWLVANTRKFHSLWITSSILQTSNVSPDLVHYLIIAGRMTLATRYLDERKLWQDIPYLNTVVCAIIWHLTLNDIEATAPSELLYSSLFACVRLDGTVLLSNDEAFSPMAHLTWLVGDDKCLELLGDLTVELSLNMLITCQPSCSDCHSVWFEKGEWTRTGCLELWGDFCAADLANSWTRTPLPSHELRPNVVRIAACKHPGENPVLRRIDRTDSDDLMKLLRRCPILYQTLPGIVDLRSSDMHGNMFGGGPEIMKIVERSPTVDSFATAMYHMGKSTTTVRHLFTSNAAHMKQRSREGQAAWEEWFWGQTKDASPLPLSDEDSEPTLDS